MDSIAIIITDMGWPIKGTGRNYNSQTGFGSFLGAYNCKVIMLAMFIVECAEYVRLQKINLDQ